MQRNGHDYVKWAPAKTFVVKRCAEPTCHEMSQVNVTAVLKIMDNLADDTAAQVRGHCCIEVNCTMGAVGACERGYDSAFEGLGALLAKRRNDPHRLCFTLLAEIFAGASLAAAQRAYRRVKKRRSRFEQFKLAKRDHILPRYALLPR
jgi:hypothetical protein